MTDEECREMLRNNYAVQMEMLGYQTDGNPKDQEPKPAETYGRTGWYGFACICPTCKKEWMSDIDDTHFCPYCGQEVKPE